MPYSMITLRAALKELGFSKGVQPFAWEQAKGVVSPELTAQFKYGRSSGNFLNDLLEYCWLVYSKALNASGPQLIGRTGDLWVPQYLQKAGIDIQQQKNLWDAHAQGNIQVMDKWSPAVNDCWILGGIHRRADFQIVSERVLKNLWEFKEGRQSVTTRELLGLIHFGYKLKQDGKKNRYICVDQGAARGSTLQEYDRYMKQIAAAGPDAIRGVLVMDLKLQNQIQNFNLSSLRKTAAAGSPRG